MKRLLLLFILITVLTAPLYGQIDRPRIQLSSTVQSSPAIDLRGLGINQIKFQWNTQGTVSAGACALLGSADNVTYGTTIIAAQTVTSSAAPTAITATTSNWVKISCTTPIAGSGTVWVDVTGYKGGDTGTVEITGDALTALESIDTSNAAIQAAVESTDPVLVQLQAIASGGASPTSWLSDGANTELVAKASAGTLYKADFTTILAATTYVRAYDDDNPDCTSATGIVARWIIPGSTTGTGGSFSFPVGKSFAVGISFCVTTTISDTNNTAVAASSFAVSVDFK